MAFLRELLVFICAATATVLAAPTIPATCPIVTLDRGTFIGTTTDGVNRFLGIPFAQPPVGDLRFRLPRAPGPYSGTHNATAFGLSCTQQATTLAIPNGLPQETVDLLTSGSGATILDGEDCLVLNVVAPSQAGRGSKLPVVVWMYGGSFEFGSSTLYGFFIFRFLGKYKEMHSYDGGVIVRRSIALEEPVIYVSMNYRLSAFGFLASHEVKDAKVGNLGLWDQRLALRWVQKYIHAFGGNPSKVTIWGESAGAVSVSLQMLASGGNTEGLFRAAFMQSGSPTPIGDITHGQKYYDDLVERTGCSGSSDTLACLRAAPYEKLKATIDSSKFRSGQLTNPESLTIAWQPRADGVFLADNPQKLVQRGKVARIPFVTGVCDDEGTIFALSASNLTTEADLRNYLSEFFLPNATDAELDELLTLYPQDVTQGSPYDTGIQNAFTPQFKRLASILGDFGFQVPRRFFLNNLSEKQNTWSFLSKRLKSLPVLGSFHGSDNLNIYGGGDLTDYLIHFATNLDPNGGLSPQWPQYTAWSRQLMTLVDSQVTNRTITLDRYRVEGMELLTKLSLAYPL
ncbi:carotenoid ester lipase precursor [Lactarius pseudohatsudake]|nr:carotenoid ester lipase precursor [Lactarius pseudohatsudake]